MNTTERIRLSYHYIWGLLKRDLDPEERGSRRLINSWWLVGVVGVARLGQHEASSRAEKGGGG